MGPRLILTEGDGPEKFALIFLDFRVLQQGILPIRSRPGALQEEVFAAAIEELPSLRQLLADLLKLTGCFSRMLTVSSLTGCLFALPPCSDWYLEFSLTRTAAMT